LPRTTDNILTTEYSNKKIFGLDFLRAIAIILVFLWHYRRYGCPEWLTGIAKFGWTGVDLFFVLSGYLIGGQLFGKIANNQPISPYEFYFKRFFRIIPAYLVVLILYYCIPAFNERDSISPLWKFLTFTMNFGLDYQNAGAFSHAWSLCIEEQFYLLLPILILLLTKIKVENKAFIILLSLFIFGFIMRIYSWQTYVAPIYEDKESMGLIGNSYSKYVYYPTYNRLDGLLVGVAIALLFSFRPKTVEKIMAKANYLFGLGIIILTAAYFLSQDQFSFRTAVLSYPLVSIGYGFLVVAVLSTACFINKFNFKIFSFLATISYSVYLTHKQLNHIVQNILANHDINKNWALLICFFISIIGGLILHIIIEKPFLVLRGRLLKGPSIELKTSS
jgi:peptidoglycan/LPS O-acetylase OafA/YrhL